MTEKNPRRGRGRPPGPGVVLCPRCREMVPRVKYSFPEGRICGRCFDTATHTHGLCPACGVDRLLPGLNSQGAPICADCAEIRTSFRCTVCGQEGALKRAGQCETCVNRSDLNAYLRLDAPDADPRLVRLRERLLGADRPASIYQWLRLKKPRALLEALGAGTVSIGHDALDALAQDATVRHLRALLVDVDALPRRDEPLAQFEMWIREKAALVVDESARDTVERFASWHHLRRLRTQSTRTDSHRGVHNAKQEITVAVDFANWLAERSTTLADCRQSDIDVWLVTGNTTRYTIRSFLQFTARSRATAPLDVPRRAVRATRRMTQDDRLDAIRRFLQDDAIRTADRVAMLLLLVFGQPIARIVEFPKEVIQTQPDGRLVLVVAADAAPIPEPFAGLVRDHLASRSRDRTGNITGNPFLFPGTRAGSHMTQNHLHAVVTGLGVNVLAAKNGALDDLVAAMPAPLVADTLGFSYTAIGQHERYRGSQYERYVHARGALRRRH